MNTLLTREEFNTIVFERDNYHCAICKDKEDVVVHHILDRKCFKNGGYFAKNGITLCKQCHWRAEKGEYTCDELRKFAKIDEKLLPSDFNFKLDYDKFGNVIKNKLLKYPRTPHIFGSGIGKDDDPDTIPHSELFNKYLVIEEKIDGASSGLSFNQDCELMLQCRGHYLLGNGDWPEFDQFKVWGNTFKDQIFDTLSDRYIMYGEWMSAFHSVFYDALPHFFMEFDIYDRKEEVFLDTKRRHEMISKMPMKIESVRVVGEGKFYSINSILALIGISAFISEQACDTLAKICDANKIPEKDKEIFLKLNQSRLMEGLYIKWEEDGIVKDRYKYVRPDFVQTILSYGKHWLDRPSMPNKMMGGASMFTLKGE
jgi:hypothetical protein